MARAAWMEARQAELLPVPYFHVVFTLPAEIRPLALQNKRVVYGILFQAAAETLQEVAANPKHLGAEIGFLTVLHTWGQNLMHHPHVPCVVTGGGLAPDRSRWVHCQRSRRRKRLFFAPVEILSQVFRGKFSEFLKRTFRRGQLAFHGKLASLIQPTKVMKLTSSEFIRRFWMQTLPRGFVRIRYYGFLANRDRHQRLDQCRRLLGAPTQPMQPAEEVEVPAEDSPCPPPTTCPICGHRSLVSIDIVPAIVPCPPRRPYFLTRHAGNAVCLDTS